MFIYFLLEPSSPARRAPQCRLCWGFYLSQPARPTVHTPPQPLTHLQLCFSSITMQYYFVFNFPSMPSSSTYNSVLSVFLCIIVLRFGHVVTCGSSELVSTAVQDSTRPCTKVVLYYSSVHYNAVCFAVHYCTVFFQSTDHGH